MTIYTIRRNLIKATNALGHVAYTQFDYYLGRPVDGEDINEIVSSGYYADALDRPTKVIKSANNTSTKSQVTFAYDEVNRTITTQSDFSFFQDGQLKSVVLYDGLGRTYETRSYETSTTYITSKQEFDELGRVKKSYNPYRTGETQYYSTPVYDALGRVTSVTTADNSVATTSFSGNTVTVTDQAGKVRRSVSDGLGRLIRVDEPDANGNLGSVSSPNQPTSYTYSVLDDLLTVSQGVQTRTFVYDSLKRLTSATNPESGTVSFVYDDNGNLTQKTDARSIQTNIAYDALSRPTSKTYSNEPSGVTTPPVYFYYDNQTLPTGAPSFSRGYSIGGLVAICYGSSTASAGTYRGYDALGRISTQIQQTDSVNYVTDAAYGITSLSSVTYPNVPNASDRRVATPAYDYAGRLSSLTSNATTYASGASVSGIVYASHGGMISQTYGNNLIEQISYDPKRLQPTEIKLGTIGNPTSVLDLTYNYGTTNNNGNLQSTTYNGGGLSYTQSFTYDSLNRLSTATETNGSTTNWSQTNGYDRYGNRWIVTGGNPSLTFDTSTNRIVGQTYDSSGNITNDGVHTYLYDSENRIIKVDGTEAYRYDGEGKRVRKLVGENTRFVYGIGSELLIELSISVKTGAASLKKEYVYCGGTMATIEPSIGTQYSTTDILGSPRVITDSSGNVVSRHDYMPFGEELFAGTGGRSSSQGFGGAETLRKKFTGYERDTETGLDFAQARYYASTNGRFQSPDPLASSATTADPQSWNRYAYVGNNPMTSTDPSGMEATRITSGGDLINRGFDMHDKGVYGGADLAKEAWNPNLWTLSQDHAYLMRLIESIASDIDMIARSPRKKQTGQSDSGGTESETQIALDSVQLVDELPMVDMNGNEDLNTTKVLATGKTIGSESEVIENAAKDRLDNNQSVFLRLLFGISGNEKATFTPADQFQTGTDRVTFYISKEPEVNFVPFSRVTDGGKSLSVYIPIKLADGVKLTRSPTSQIIVSTTAFWKDAFTYNKGVFGVGVPRSVTAKFSISLIYKPPSRAVGPKLTRDPFPKP